MPATKIATCCYCGTRAALVLRGQTRHELSCAACGAPLHNLKALPVAQARAAKSASVHSAPQQTAPPSRQPNRPSNPRRRKRKSLSRIVLSEALDLIEDIFD